MAYITPDALRTRVSVLDDPEIEDEHLEDLVAEFEDICERYLNVAYEPREETETADLCRASKFLTKWPKVTAVSEITVDDVAVTGHTFTDGWSIELGSTYTGVFSVTYTHGFEAPTPTILRACREYVRACALADRSSVPRDVISQSGDGFTTRYSTPDWSKGRPTGYTEVDRLLRSVQSYRIEGIA